jgi:RNA polymerase sigma factor (sigma-70 family)
LRNPADAEDVTQTTFMNAYRAFKRGEEIRKPQNWLIKIAHNAARNRYARMSRRAAEVSLDDHLEQLSVPESERPDVQAVLDALAQLPLNQRGALVMRELEGRSYAEIADALDVSVPAVETLIFRARRSLRLRASDIKVIGLVPLPSSLSRLLGTGGMVSSGGALLGGGGGLVLKAAVAIVAGVVATGLGSDRPRQAEAAAVPPAQLSPFSTGSSWVLAGSGRSIDGQVLMLPGQQPPRDDAVTLLGDPALAAGGEPFVPGATSVLAVGPGGGVQSPSAVAVLTSPATAAAATALNGVTTTASSTTATATTTVSSAVNSVTKAIPVQAPVPIGVPAVTTPPLPAPAPLPSPPPVSPPPVALPSPPPVTVPQPPPLPPLPTVPSLP